MALQSLDGFTSVDLCSSHIHMCL